MKSEERHQLHTNELAQSLESIIAWVKENRNTVIYAVVVVILVLVSVYFKYFRARPAASPEQLEMTQLSQQVEMGKLQVLSAKPEAPVKPELLRSAADRLGGIAGRLDDNQSEAFALIKQGEALRAEVHYTNMDEKAQRFQLDKARKAYEDAKKAAGSNIKLAGLAQLGLGLTEEDSGNFDQARKIYTQLKDDPNFAGTIAHQLGAKRLVTMSDYRGTFTFIELPKPAMPEANAPAAPKAPSMRSAEPVKPAPAPEANSAAKSK